MPFCAFWKVLTKNGVFFGWCFPSKLVCIGAKKPSKKVWTGRPRIDVVKKFQKEELLGGERVSNPGRVRFFSLVNYN